MNYLVIGQAAVLSLALLYSFAYITKLTEFVLKVIAKRDAKLMFINHLYPAAFWAIFWGMTR